MPSSPHLIECVHVIQFNSSGINIEKQLILILPTTVEGGGGCGTEEASDGRGYQWL